MLMRFTIGRAAVGIVLTESLRPALECVLPSQRVFVVSNGIDAPNTGDRRIRSNTTVRVLFLSALVRWKGPLVFIDAFARARQACPFLRGTVAGPWASDEMHDEVLQLTRDLGVERVLSFPGSVVGEAKDALFESADIFCFASLVPEGQPLVILEAMAAGLPVIAPIGPGIADTVVDGETGLLVPVGSVEALADRLVDLARSADHRIRLGAAGRRRYERLFTQNAFGDRMTRLIRPFIDQDEESGRATETPAAA